jgi:ankyrin repeat protein
VRLEGQVDELITAIKQRDRQAVTLLLDRDPALASGRSATGGTPAITAIYRRAGEILDLLRARGVAFDVFEAAASGDERRVLHLAAHFRHQKMVELLLERGADVHLRARNSHANTPRHAALAGGAGVALVQRLLDAGVTVDARQGGGYTGLHEAASLGSAENVRLRLEAGADPDARTLTERARIG